jgi:hypothetical protein
MLIEDVACPTDKLADMMIDLIDMFQRFGYHDASCFGHALEGNLHLVFSQVRRAGGQWAAGGQLKGGVRRQPRAVAGQALRRRRLARGHRRWPGRAFSRRSAPPQPPCRASATRMRCSASAT